MPREIHLLRYKDIIIGFTCEERAFQVFDLHSEAPDKVMHKLYGNLEKLKAKGDHLAAEILNRLRLIVSTTYGPVVSLFPTSSICR